MRVVRIEIEASSDRAEELEAAAYSLGVQGLEVVDESTGGLTGRVCIRIYLPAGAETEKALRTLRKALHDVAIEAVEISAATQGSEITRIGRGFFVAASDRRSGSRTRLLIDASSAFGDGVHPTTQLVVAALENHFASRRPTRTLDIGSGTGVLGLVALCLGTREVVATDVDALARAATKAAAKRHGFEKRLSVRSTLPSETYPLVVANLYRDVLLALAPRIAARVARRGSLFVSGFSVASRGEVVRAFESAGLRLESTRSRATWVCAKFSRP